MLTCYQQQYVRQNIRTVCEVVSSAVCKAESATVFEAVIAAINEAVCEAISTPVCKGRIQLKILVVFTNKA